MVKTNIQTFTGDVEVLEEFHVGSNLVANDTASNVLTVVGSIGANTFIGDGGLLSNIATTLGKIVDQGNTVANVVQFSSNTGYGGVGIVTTSNVGIQNTNPLHTLSIGDKVYFSNNTNEALGQSVMVVDGRINATRFEGDGGLLSNIATTLDQIVDQGNTVSNTVIIVSGQDTTSTSNIGLITHENVGISVSNAEPSSAFQLTVGDALFVNTYGSNVLTVQGNAAVSNLLVTEFTVSPAHNLQHVTQSGSASDQTIQLTNATTGLVVSSNATVGGNVTAESVISAANVEVGNRLKFSGSNVFVDTLRVADVAANIVTYDRTTGELLDSSGTFMNKFAVVSEQPPSNFFANTTTVANHGTYTLTTSNLATDSNTFNAFDGTANAWVSGDGYIGGSNVFHETNLTQLSNLHPTQFGDWLAIEFPYKTTLRHMKLTPLTTAQFPASANLYATNNDLTWSEIKYWKDVNPVTSSNVQTIVVNATEQFKKYALVATKAAGNSANVAIQDWQLFTESFSIDGGKVAMASSAVMGGETTVEQSGPHRRNPTTPLLKKFPEIAFDASKLDGSRTSTDNTYDEQYYLQAGTIVKVVNETASRVAHQAFNGDIVGANGNGWSSLFGFDRNTGLYDTSNNHGDTFTDTNGDPHLGMWIQTKFPNKIKVKNINLYIGNNLYRYPKSLVVLGHSSLSSLTGWTLLHTETNISTTTPAVGDTTPTVLDVNADTAFDCYTILVKSARPEGTAGQQSIWVSEIEYYGYEEDPPAGDTSIDTTFTSIMNTPQTTGANVYVDGNLGETFTNRVTGPTVSNTATSYDQTGKYWTLTGALTSNVTVEANTFLEGDAPHSVSVWFNSSNLEANVSNTCVFSISDQEKLDSQNLDLQSNTWHNLTYAYQGEGGSRVTYLDGRKVAEDQAEDTFGDYPPFAMTGYSQGGYVVSASSVFGSYKVYAPFNDLTTQSSTNVWMSENGKYNSGGDGTPTGSADTTVVDGTLEPGEWIQIEMPHKLRVNYIEVAPQTLGLDRAPTDAIVAGSNDGNTWTSLGSWTGVSDWAVSGSEGVYKTFVMNTNVQTSFKYVRLIITKTDGVDQYAAISELKLYGHRENDLVRLPDPTNVLKYPHIAMTGPAQRGYVASASSFYNNWQQYAGWTAFNETVDDPDGWVSYPGSYSSGIPSTYSGVTQPDKLTGIDATSSYGNQTERNGSWLKIEVPHKLRLSQMKLFRRRADQRIVDGFIYGSNDNSTFYQISSNLSEITNIGTYSNTTPLVINSTDTTTPFKQFVVQVTKNTTIVNYTNIGNIELYGTEENSSIPIQIGGGNIDRVANFRVYDKFIGEDQALEIWDAQKDEFGRAKSSMTLHKGRLGIGTTEPEGRLAVLDEPHNLEEFPPRAMTAEETYMEGHGVFKAFDSIGTSKSSAFNKNPNDIVYISGQVYDETSPYSANALAPSTMGIYGSWIQLNCPYGVNVSKVLLSPRNGYENEVSMASGYLFGSNDEILWDEIYHFTNIIQPTQGDYVTFDTTSNSKYYKYLRLVCTNLAGLKAGDMNWQHAEIRYFGTREQGQSVLHDGQLTLTKSLTVPRIGPALDADDTPRRDRLVVEYNTSTNPTFEGAVRDTSGRGLDGALIGGAMYDVTGKAFEFPNNPVNVGPSTGKDSIITHGIPGTPLNTQLTVSTWVRLDSPAQWEQIWGLGNDFTSLENEILYVANSQLSYQTEGGGGAIYYPYTYTGWNHVTIVRNSATFNDVTFYVNGSVVASTSTSGTGTVIKPDKVKLTIGGSITQNNYWLDGAISNFKLYDCALTAEEVKTLYDMGRCDEGHHVVNFSKTRVGIGLGDGEAPRGALDVRGDLYLSGNIIRNTSSAKSGGVWLPTYQFEVGGATFVEDQRHGQYHIINNQVTAVYRARVVSNSGAGTLRISVPGGIQPAGHVTGNTIVIGWWARNSDLGSTNVGPYLITNAGDGYAQLWHPGQTNGQVRLDGGSLEADQYWTVFLSYPVE